jgi:hypothetical protein
MFCNEHGPTNYCPECLMEDFLASEISYLRAQIKQAAMLTEMMQKRHAELTGKRFEY